MIQVRSGGGLLVDLVHVALLNLKPVQPLLDLVIGQIATAVLLVRQLGLVVTEVPSQFSFLVKKVRLGIFLGLDNLVLLTVVLLVRSIVLVNFFFVNGFVLLGIGLL